MFFMKGMSTPEEIDAWANVAVKLWDAPIDISVKISTASCLRRISQQSIMTHGLAQHQTIMANFVKASL